MYLCEKKNHTVILNFSCHSFSETCSTWLLLCNAILTENYREYNRNNNLSYSKSKAKSRNETIESVDLTLKIVILSM